MRRWSFRSIVAGLMGLSVVALLTGGGRPGPDFGDPLPRLTAAERQLFLDGREAFSEEENAEDGVGPVFTQNGCAICHGVPAIGGGSAIVETRIGRWRNGVFDPLAAFGGPVIQDRAIDADTGYFGPFPFVGEVVPPEAEVVAGRRSTPLFGLGLVEAVPDEALVALARRQPPEVAGRPHEVVNFATGKPAIGRFGWKAQLSTLLEFAADAYTNEMGITTPLVPDENCPQGDCAALAFNPLPSDVPNEPDNEDVIAFSNFMRLLAPPPRGAGARDRRARAGEALFASIGCAACHVPSLRTGRSRIGALDRVKFQPYSDFLLHDMGSLGDGIAQGKAGPREMRTAPLWGVSRQPLLLHDGRATTLEDAIAGHDGQARPARERFDRLSADEQRALIAFLRSI